jgi:hypothetical protein
LSSPRTAAIAARTESASTVSRRSWRASAKPTSDLSETSVSNAASAASTSPSAAARACALAVSKRSAQIAWFLRHSSK